MNRIISRKEAIQRGLPRYFSGRRCPKGHIAERRTRSYDCVQCRRERKRAAPTQTARKIIRPLDEAIEAWSPRMAQSVRSYQALFLVRDGGVCYEAPTQAELIRKLADHLIECDPSREDDGDLEHNLDIFAKVKRSQWSLILPGAWAYVQ